MISAVNSSPSFTSVIPIRVYIDGMETFDQKFIKSSCRQLSSILSAKPQDKQSVIEQFTLLDPHYNAKNKSSKPSDFIRCLFNKGKNFLFTGPQADLVNKYGKAVGIERRACRERGVQDSFDLMVAKNNYFTIISQLANNTKLRTSNCLNINMDSNKKYGLSTFKMHLKDISLSDS